MRKPCKSRRSPNKQQQRLLAQLLEEVRWRDHHHLHHLLAERRDAWQERYESLRLYEQQATRPALKAKRTPLAGVLGCWGAGVPSQMLHYVARRLSGAFPAGVRRGSTGERLPALHALGNGAP